MTETPHIFDEFLKGFDERDDEYIHRKRSALEPLVFGILRRKYGEVFRQAFQTYKRPVKSDRCVLIIERRIHENLEFVLHNVAYYANGWNIAIVCSDLNIRYIRDILGDRRSEIYILPVFSGSPDRNTGRREYNSLLKSAEFYESLPDSWEHLLTVQMDSYLRRDIPDIIINYDFIAAVPEWDKTSMCGGMSFRKRSMAIDVCHNFFIENFDDLDEDDFLFKGCKTLGYNIPPYEIAVKFIVESHFKTSPEYESNFFGTHQWWTFWEPYPYLIPFFNILLECRLK